ncbi:MAG: AbrB family transcriptional regulator [Nitrospirae bacterium]|nr:MAG: AbrB family transcriptional regulator [Nitrospirota bacterium]
MCCGTSKTSKVNCRVESILSIDDRGQMVLPKEVRERAGICPGDRLVVTSWEKDGKVCCLTLMKGDALAEMVKGQLGPIIGVEVKQDE